jgi:cell division septation protein DedD
MQHNFQPKNKSHLIRVTEEAKRKSRHRLMGSIFLLLVALVVLLNVTSKVKPIPLKPQNIEIKNTNQQVSNAIHALQESLPVNVSGNLKAQEASQILSTSISDKHLSSNTISNSDNIKPNTLGTTFKAQVISKNIQDNGTSISKDISTNKTTQFIPRIVEESYQQQTPEDILNGTVASSNHSNHYFIQLIASNNKAKLIKLQQDLTKEGILTFIQPIQTTNGAIYRLRMGPFANKDAANKNLATILNNNKRNANNQ